MLLGNCLITAAEKLMPLGIAVPFTLSAHGGQNVSLLL